MEHLRRGLAAVAIACAVTAGGCTSPTEPDEPAFGITCPTDPAVEVLVPPVSVTFALPTPVGGQSPISTTCTPQSGTSFAVGTTRVACQSTDANRRSASCSFNVIVRLPPRLLYTRFLAFGDSITEGKIADPPLVISSLGSPLRFLDVDRITTLANALEPYPLGLQRRLVTKYPSQTFRVANAGLGGEFVSDGGLARFGGAMAAEQPEVVLLMEGTNDLLSPSGVDTAINALDLMIQQALGQGRRVCLATIPPQRPNGLRNRAAVAARIPGFNDRVRTLAASRQVLLADVYNAMKDDLSLIGIDDLHPTERGYAVIADTFSAAISNQFQQPQPPTPSSSSVW